MFIDMMVLLTSNFNEMYMPDLHILISPFSMEIILVRCSSVVLSLVG